MAFVDTINSLKKKMLQDSLERSVTVTPSNNTFTINPNKAALFLVNVAFEFIVFNVIVDDGKLLKLIEHSIGI